jgi:hypothetical protein
MVALSEQRAKHDAAQAAAEAAEVKSKAALAELNLGMETKEAHVKATELFAQADAVQKQSQIDAAEAIKAAQAQAAAIVAEAQGLHDAASATKADADADRAAVATERQQLASEREAARRLGDEAEKTRALLEYRMDYIRIILDEFCREGTGEEMKARISDRVASLKPVESRLN